MDVYAVNGYLRQSFALEPAQAPEDLTWQDAARCAEVDSDIFFPPKGGSTRPAKLVCRGCEVRELCLQFALEHEDICRHGIWGATTERERRRIKRERAAEAASRKSEGLAA